MFFVGYAEHDGRHGLPELRGNEGSGTARRTEGPAPAQQFTGAGKPADVPGIRGRGSGEAAIVAVPSGEGLQRREQHGAPDEAEDAREQEPHGAACKCGEAIYNSLRGGQRGQHGRNESQEFDAYAKNMHQIAMLGALSWLTVAAEADRALRRGKFTGGPDYIGVTVPDELGGTDE